MVLFSKESLLQLRSHVDLVEVLSRHIELKRSGATYKALCPFHEEKSPSFMIKRGDTHYHCFGCGAHGDAIQFLMTYLHLSFIEAVEMLAEQFHVRIEKVEEKEKGVDRDLIKRSLAIASEFFHFYLMHTEEGMKALEYLFARGLNVDFLRRFQVGLAPEEGGLFRKLMKEKNIPDEILAQAGLLTNDGRSFFRERITFPIHSATGVIVGFSARKYKETTTGGKYINGPETLLFKKSRTLFGLNYSRRRIAKERKAIVVEGQIDALQMIDGGFDTTVAALGTAFTEEHVRELKNLGLLMVHLLFDGDKSGEAAASKVGHLFQKQGIDVKVVSLLDGYDPDKMLKEYGKERVAALLEKGVDYLTFQVNHLSKEFDVSLPASKREMIGRIASQIREWEDPVIAYESFKKLAQLTQVPEALLAKERAALPTKKVESAPPLFDFDRALEIELLRWLFLVPEEKILQMVMMNIASSDITDPMNRKLFEATYRLHQNKKTIDFLHLVSEVEGGEEEEKAIEEIFSKNVKREKAEAILRDCIQKILDRKWLKEREKIQKEIESKTKSEEEITTLIKAFDELKRNRPQVK